MSVSKKIVTACLPTAIIIAALLLVYCAEDTPDRCGDGHALNTHTQFCHNNQTYDKCEQYSTVYDPTTHGCDKDSDRLLTRCGSDLYDTLTQFCLNGQRYDKCGGGEGVYSPTTYFCEDDVLHKKCGGSSFATGTHFCWKESMIFQKCGGSGYDLDMSFCSGETVYPKCNGQVYSPPNNPCDMRALLIIANPPNWGVVSRNPDLQNYPVGTTVSLTALPAHGYEFIGWTGIEAAGASVEFEMTGNMSLIANFRQETRARLTANPSPSAGGSVTVSPAATDERGYAIGAEITVTAEAAEGYEFVRWTWTGVPASVNATNPSITFDITGSTTLTANFTEKGSTPKICTLQVIASPTNGGWIVSRSPEQENYQSGTLVKVTAEPSSGWRIVNWTTGTGAEVCGSGDVCEVMVNDNTTLTANFEQEAAPVRHIVTINMDPSDGGDVSLSPSQPSDGYPDFTEITVTATAKTGYRFIRWSGGGFEGNTSPTLSFNIADSITLTAKFGRERTLTTNVTPANSGAVNNRSGTNTHTYVDGDTAVIIAVSSGNYVFEKWTGDGIADTNSASTTVSMTGDREVTAHFRAKPKETFTDERDSKVYEWVTIGTQVWMAENLNYAGTGGTVGVCYDNADSNCVKYGRLYTWSEAMNGASSSNATPSGVQGACPVGWHLPSVAEWTTLVDYVGDKSTAGSKLKSQTGWNSYSGISSTDEYGFSALPGGVRYPHTFDNAGGSGYWWSATERGNELDDAEYHFMSHYGSLVGWGWANKDYSYSVRCVKDNN